MTEADRNSPRGLNGMPSEAQMFRVVVGVGIALLPVFVLSLLAGPGWAALLLVFEIGIAIGVWWRRRSASAQPDEG